MIRSRSIIKIATVIAFAITGMQVVALSPKDIALAQKVIAQVAKMSVKYDDVELIAPEPLPDANGKYVSPYKSDGEVTEWAQKSVTAEAGALAGDAAGDAAANQIAKKIPFGGLLRKKTKSAATSAGAATALGGWDAIRAGSDVSFARMDQIAVYLHVHHRDDPAYDETLAATMHLYPELKKGYRKSLDKAYKEAKKARKR